jgi:CheY-like chemotaxis protein
VELWGGQIQVQSEVGQGTIFSFTMPLVELSQAVQPKQENILLCTVSESLVDLWREDSNAPLITWVSNISEFNSVIEGLPVDRFIIDCRFRDANVSDLVSKVREKNPRVTVVYMGCDSSMKNVYKASPQDKFASWPLLVSDLWQLNSAVNKPVLMNAVKNKFPDFSHLTILGVDDNTTNLLVLSGLLKRMKVNCITATSGDKAIALVNKHHFDMILMDYDMPGMDGVEATRKIRETKPLLIVGLSAHVGEFFEREAYDVGMAGFLTKPLNYRSLERLLLKHFKPVESE